MNSFEMTLRKSIERSGYSIYKVASKSGVNRTTLQKILSGERPISPETLGSILNVLRLSPSEEAEILIAFEISRYGETLYLLRQAARNLLTDLSNADSFFCCRRINLNDTNSTPPLTFRIRSCSPDRIRLRSFSVS